MNQDQPTSIKTSYFLPEKQWKYNCDVSLHAYKAHLDDIKAISYWSVKDSTKPMIDGFCIFRDTNHDDNDQSKKLQMLAKCMMVPGRKLKVTRFDDHSEHPVAFANLYKALRPLATNIPKKRALSADRE